MSSDLFRPRSDQDVLRLLREQPFRLAHLRARRDPPCGAPSRFVPQARAGGRAGRPLGPPRPIQSPGQVAAAGSARGDSHPRRQRIYLALLDRRQLRAPTWNYASAQFLTNISFIEDDAGLERVLRDLIGAVGAEQPNAWSIEDMGPRYARLAQRIIAFEANFVEMRPKFKLGGGGRDVLAPDIMRGLEATEADELRTWMADFAQ